MDERCFELFLLDFKTNHNSQIVRSEPPDLLKILLLHNQMFYIHHFVKHYISRQIEGVDM